MSRSRRRTPIFGISTAVSEREDKQRWHRRWRLHERMALRQLCKLREPTSDQLDEHMPIDEKTASNVWAMAKDGRQYWSFWAQLCWAQAYATAMTGDAELAHTMCVRLIRRNMAK